MKKDNLAKEVEAVNSDRSKRNGLDYLQHVIATKQNYPFGELMKMQVVAAGDGWAEITAEPTHLFYNPMMRIHGGWLATILDTVLGSAIMTKLPEGTAAGTINLNVNYVRKVSVESGPLRARAEIKHAGKSMLTSNGEIRDAQGNICVHGTGSFLIYQ